MAKNIKSYADRLEAMRKEMYQEVIDDPDMTKVEKLETIWDNKLLEIGGSIEELFYKYIPEYMEIIKKNPKYQELNKKYKRGDKDYDPFFDDYFVMCDFDRYQVVNLAREAKNAMFGYNPNRNNNIAVMSNRVTNDLFIITKEQFVDDIYEWVLENKMIGFELDW